MEALSLASRALLVEILMEYRPGLNGRLEWSCRKAAQAIGVSKDRAARALTQLELLGWLTCERVALFGRRKAPARYALTLYPNDETGEPASFAFEVIQPDNPLLCQQHPVASEGQRGRIPGTTASRSKDTNGRVGGFVTVSDALKSSPIFRGPTGKPRSRSKG